MYFLRDNPSLWLLQVLGDLMFSLSPPLLIYFWLQRTAPFGQRFVIESFGIGAVTLGCLSMLTVVLERFVALVLVAVLPLVGAGLLVTLQGESGSEINAGPTEEGRGGWSVLRAMSGQGPRDTQADTCERGSGRGRLLAHGFIKLVPFFCYALVFGSVHFSWVGLQDEASVGMWVQLGASVGAMLCGAAAFALARPRWGRALESIMHLLLAAFAIVALWLTTFLTSGYVFAYLVLLNIAQKLVFMLILIFGFPFARTMGECTSLWSVAYFSFFLGTFVSARVGTMHDVFDLNLVTAAALIALLIVDVAGVMSLYSAGNTASPKPAGAVEPAPETQHQQTPAPSHEQPTTADSQRAALAAEGFDPLPYTCHLIAEQHDLTRREEEILQLLARGRTAARIAETLCITTATTRTHLRNIYAKLDVHSQQDILDMVEEFAKGTRD